MKKDGITISGTIEYLKNLRNKCLLCNKLVDCSGSNTFNMLLCSSHRKTFKKVWMKTPKEFTEIFKGQE